jgi:hypothetical protein
VGACPRTRYHPDHGVRDGALVVYHVGPGRRARFRHRQRLQAQGERRAHSLPRKRGACSPAKSTEATPPASDARQGVVARSGLLTSDSLSLKRPSDLPAEPIRKYASSVTTTTSSLGRWLSAARNRA